MKIIEKYQSSDKQSYKVLQLTDDNYLIETGVFNDFDTVHLCISSQIGCPIGCKMCYNGVANNYYRNLTKIEIIEQVQNIIDDLKLMDNFENIWISFMGVGEPLLNYDNVISTINYFDKKYKNCNFAIATTLPQKEFIYYLINDLKNIKRFKLTLSLHAATDEKRKQLIPTHSSLADLREAMDLYKKYGDHKCEWNYVLLDNFNDSDEDYDKLLEFINRDDRIKISSYNEIEFGNFQKSNSERYQKIHDMLDQKNIYNVKFDSVGESIKVGCGQMAAKKLEKIRKGV